MSITAKDGNGNLITLKTYTDGGEHVRAIQVDGTVTIQDGGNTITVDGEVVIDDSTPVEVNIVEMVDVKQDTHDDLNLNANLQVADADVGNANPVPISDADGSLTIDGEVGLITGSSVIGKVATGYDKAQIDATLIGTDDDISSPFYTSPVTVNLTGSGGGNILSIALHSVGGGVLTPNGVFYIFNQSPSLADFTASISSTSIQHIIGMIRVSPSDWEHSGQAATAFFLEKIPFDTTTLYVMWRHLDDTAYNSSPGDDESLTVSFMYQVDV